MFNIYDLIPKLYFSSLIQLMIQGWLAINFVAKKNFISLFIRGQNIAILEKSPIFYK